MFNIGWRKSLQNVNVKKANITAIGDHLIFFSFYLLRNYLVSKDLSMKNKNMKESLEMILLSVEIESKSSLWGNNLIQYPSQAYKSKSSIT